LIRPILKMCVMLKLFERLVAAQLIGYLETANLLPPLQCTVFQMFRPYLNGRQQSVQHGSDSSKPVIISCGLPQGSVLGPILFVLYTADIAAFVQRSGLVPDLYADDTQVYRCWLTQRTGDLTS